MTLSLKVAPFVQTNDSGFEHLTDEQIVGQALDPVSEDGEEEDKTQQRTRHKAALAHAVGLIKYRKDQDDVSLCDKMLIKKVQSQI